MRITKPLKLAIQNNAVIAAGLHKRIAKLQESTAKIADEIRVAHLGGPEKAAEIESVSDKIKALYLDLPETLRGHYSGVNQRESITIRFSADNTSDRFTLYLAGYPYKFAYRGAHLVDHDYQQWLIKGAVHKNETAPRCGGFMAGKFSRALCNKARKCQEAWDVIEAELQEIWTSVGAAVDSVTTTKKLLEVWPEAQKLLPPEEQKMHLPAMPTARLNSMLNL